MSATEPSADAVRNDVAGVLLIRPQVFGSRIRAAMSTRLGGVSAPPFDTLNLGYSTADDPRAVAENERRFADAFGVAPGVIRWAHQVHGTALAHAEDLPPTVGTGAHVEADAIVSRTPGLACAIKIADCVPVLLADREARVVAAVHAGWRGVAAGIVGLAVHALRSVQGDVPASQLCAWIGPCIGFGAFEIGAEVADALRQAGATPSDLSAPYVRSGTERCRANLRTIVRHQLIATGLVEEAIETDPRCTFEDAAHFFSHRRDGRTGRMAAVIMIEP